MMLATWLAEIYLAKINELEDLAASEVSQEDAANMLVEQGHVEDEMRQLLSAYRVHPSFTASDPVAEQNDRTISIRRRLMISSRATAGPR